MLKIRIEQKGKPVQNIIKPAEKFVINIDIPISIQHVNATYYDKANAKEGKTMEDLCRDVAEILKNEYSFKILKEDQKRIDSNGNRVITEGHPSDFKDSLSLYYYIRYNIALSDAFANDGISFNNSVSAILQTDLVIKVTTHPFNENGDLKTRQFDRNKLKELAEQEGSDPDYLSLGRKQVGISDLVRYHYEDGLTEIRNSIKDEILNWRREVFNYISKTKKGN